MKRFVFTAIMLASVVGASAQIPPASEPVCAFCEARFTKGESHKPGCPNYVEEVEEPQSTQDDTVWDDPSKYSTDEFNVGLGPGRICPECGKDSHTASNCGIARLQYSQVYWHNQYMISKRKKRKAAEAKRDEIEAQLKKRYEYYTKNPVTPSTKLKDHTPMPEQFEQRPENPSMLIPKMDKMPPPVLPTTIQLVNVREKANDGTSTVYDKRIQFRDRPTSVARGITNKNGTETWVLFKAYLGEETKVATFSKITTIDEGDLWRYYVCRDMNGKWGLYNLYCKKELDHEFSSIEAIAYNKYNDKRGIVLKCCRNGKYGLLTDIGDTVNCEYDDIQLEAGNKFRVLKDGKYGIISESGNAIIPAEYTYIERLSYQNVEHTFYIVSKDNINYGVFVNSTSIKYKRDDYSLGEAREQVKADAFKLWK